MAKNVYFTHGTFSEQRLVEDLIIESIKIYGHDVYYLPREIVNRDYIFNEDTSSIFDENYLIEVYLLNYEGFEGDGTLLTKFGVRISEEATFVVSRRRWEDLVSSSSNLVSNERPNEGDAIYFPLTKQLFQIKYVENEIPLRQLGDLPTFQLICELMEYSDERLETGVDEIDQLPIDTGYSITFDLKSGGILDFIINNGGTGYNTSSTVTFGQPGVGAKATPVISNGTIVDLNLLDPGESYTSSTAVLISGGNSDANVEIVVSNDRNYEYGEIVSGTYNTARSKSNLLNDTVDTIDVYKSGSGYVTAPEVFIGPPDLPNGVQATAIAVITNGVVTSVNVSNPGSGYVNAPEVLISPSPTEAQGKVIRFDYTNRQLELININGSFKENETLRGLTSNSEWMTKVFSTIEKQNDPLSDSLDIEIESDQIIDWTEKNPFGEYGNMGVF